MEYDYRGYRVVVNDREIYRVYVEDRCVGEYTSEFQTKNAISTRRKDRLAKGLRPIG